MVARRLEVPPKGKEGVWRRQNWTERCSLAASEKAASEAGWGIVETPPLAVVIRLVPFSAAAVVGSSSTLELAIAPPEVTTFQTPTTTWATPLECDSFVLTVNCQLPAGKLTLPEPSTIQPLPL